MDNLTEIQKLKLRAILEAAFMAIDEPGFKKQLKKRTDIHKCGEIDNQSHADLITYLAAITPKPTEPVKPNLRLV